MNTMREIMMLGAVLGAVALAVPVMTIWKGTSRAFPTWSEFAVRPSDPGRTEFRADAGLAEPVGPGPMPFAMLAISEAPAARRAEAPAGASLLPAAGLAFLCACLHPYATR